MQKNQKLFMVNTIEVAARYKQKSVVYTEERKSPFSIYKYVVLEGIRRHSRVDERKR